MLRKGTVMIMFLALLVACAQNGKQSDGTNQTDKPASGLREIGILARGME